MSHPPKKKSWKICHSWLSEITCVVRISPLPVEFQSKMFTRRKCRRFVRLKFGMTAQQRQWRTNRKQMCQMSFYSSKIFLTSLYWWLNQPSWKIWRSNWVHLPPNRDENKKIFELPPASLFMLKQPTCVSWIMAIFPMDFLLHLFLVGHLRRSSRCPV